MGIELTADETWEFLERGHTAIFTSLRRDGRPVALPVWYAVLDRCLYVRGPSHTRKFERVRRDDRVSLLVESGEAWKELKAVHVSGRARIVEDPDIVQRVGEHLEEKYRRFRTESRRMPGASQRHYGSGTTLLRIEPEEWISWDNAKLRLRR
ncbi:MAG: pyridoxamine 5'-phosphate oxidase family protein [Proteobacteria bacterium]|nr:pyridoxamine 5'-phosphate oxidase family protein [Pseudomonadota bacterium]